MGAIASQITSLTVVFSTVYLDTNQRKLKSSASLAFVRGSYRGGEFPAQMASNAENVSIWGRHHVFTHPCPNSAEIKLEQRKVRGINMYLHPA